MDEDFLTGAAIANQQAAFIYLAYSSTDRHGRIHYNQIPPRRSNIVYATEEKGVLVSREGKKKRRQFRSRLKNRFHDYI